MTCAGKRKLGVTTKGPHDENYDRQSLYFDFKDKLYTLVL